MLYGGYPLWAQAAFGWAVSIAVFASGFIICAIPKGKKLLYARKNKPIKKR